MSLHAINTPKWDPEQALISAMEMDSESLFIVSCSKEGVWESITAGPHKTGDLLLAAEVLRRRAFQSMEDW